MWRPLIRQRPTALLQLVEKIVQFLIQDLDLLPRRQQILRLQRHLRTHRLQRIFLKRKARLQIGDLFCLRS